MLKVKGYPSGWCTGSTAKAVKFIILKDEHEPTEIGSFRTDAEQQIPDYFPITKDFGLPTYSPWVLFHVLLKKPRVGSVYEIDRVYRCERRFKKVTKKDIVQYACQDKPQDMQKALKACFKDLPRIVTDPNLILDKIKNIKVQKWIYPLVETHFKSDTFYALMRYFSATFLAKFTEEELLAIQTLIATKPYAFCFRTYLHGILTNLQLPEGKLLFPESSDRLKVLPKFCKVFADKAINHGGLYQIAFDYRYPFWSVQTALYAIEDYDVRIPCSEHVLADALVMYEDAELQRYTYGHSIFDATKLGSKIRVKKETDASVLPAKMDDFFEPQEPAAFGSPFSAHFARAKERVGIANRFLFFFPHWGEKLSLKKLTFLFKTRKDAVEFLIDFDIMQYCLGDGGVQRWITLPDTEYADLCLARLIRDKVTHLSMIHCTRYDEEYLKRLQQLVLSLSTNVDVSNRNMVVLSHSIAGAQYIQDWVQSSVYSVPEYISLLENRAEEVEISNGSLLLVLESFHKFSTATMIKILQLIDPLVQIQLVIVGDATDYGPYSELSEDTSCNLARDFFSAFDGENSMGETWEIPIVKHPDSTEPTVQDYYRHVQGRNMGSLDIAPIEGPANIHDVLKAFEKYVKKNAKERASKEDYTLQIFCSTDFDREVAIRSLMQGQGYNYDSHAFSIGDEVHVLEYGMVGRIETIQQQNECGKWIDVLPKKKAYFNQMPCNVTIVCDRGTSTFCTTDVTISLAHVTAVKKYPGGMVDHGFFYVGQYTRDRDLLSAIKYCKKTFKILLQTGFPFMDIYKDSFTTASQSDLISKLKLIPIPPKIR